MRRSIVVQPDPTSSAQTTEATNPFKGDRMMGNGSNRSPESVQKNTHRNGGFPSVDPSAASEQNPSVATSKRDVAHFDVIGRAMAVEKFADCVEASSSSPAERIRTGFLLGDVPRTIAINAAIDADALGQIGLAKRRPVRRK